MSEQNVLELITVNTHSSIRIGGERVIYIDPLSVEGAPHDADLILFTHPHADHFSPRDAKKLLKESTVIAAPKSMAGLCRIMLGREIKSLLPGEKYEQGGVKFETVAAYNKSKPFHLKAMKWLGYIINVGDTRVYISGDTDITDESRSVRCDIAMLPIGGFYTIDPIQAAELAKAVSAHTVIPVHYGRLLGGEDAPEKFRRALDEGIKADIRPNVYSNVLVKMYLTSAALILLGGTIGYIVGHMM